MLRELAASGGVGVPSGWVGEMFARRLDAGKSMNGISASNCVVGSELGDLAFRRFEFDG